jgi:cell division protein FtsB
VVLGLVLAGLALSLALPVREYVRQRSDISALQTEAAQRQARVAELQHRLQQWQDPAYVATQARSRLQYVMPGEVGYVVLDPKEAPAPAAIDTTASAPVEDTPWYSVLWSSVHKADVAAVVRPAAPAGSSTKSGTKPAPSPSPKARTSSGNGG